MEKEIITLLSHPGYTPLTLEELDEELELTTKEQKQLKKVLLKLADNGKVVKIKHGRYALPSDADLISGIIKFKPSGKAIIIPTVEPGQPAKAPIPLLAQDTGLAFHKDTVVAKLYKKRAQGRYSKGRRIGSVEQEVHARVKQVLHRRYETITGTLNKGRNYYYVTPDDPCFVHDIAINDPAKSNIKPRPKLNDKLVVKLFEWDHMGNIPEGTIIKNLGPTHTPMAEYEALLIKHNLSPEFPGSVVRDLKHIPNKVRKEDIKNRLDCRKIYTLTIDPDDAQDFDDALSMEQLDEGRWQIGIHIADVGAYIEQESILDKEAKARGNSTYLVGSVIPMLPKQVSNGICSLVEDEDRLTKSIFITFSKNGEIEDSIFANTVIRSDKRLTYRQAYAFLQEEDIEAIKNQPTPPAFQTGATGKPLSELSTQQLKKIQKSVRQLWDFASKLRKARMKKGSLDFDMPEVKIYLDKEGHADRIETIENDASHQLIEEFMLLANETIAKRLFENKIPYISRVHDKPDSEKLNELRDTLITFGVRTGDLTQRNSVTRFLSKIKGHPQGYTMKIHFLRSLKQACYRAKADGHYGLHKEYYAHFTSPIRRYSDLIVHRIFDNYLIKTGCETAMSTMTRHYKQSELNSLSQHLSITEQNSTEAERESVKIKLLEYFEIEAQRKDRRAFKAIITDIRNYAMFVELTESLAFGLVHFSTLKDDIYKFNPQDTSLVGRKQGKTFNIGEEIEVMVDRVDRFKRQMDFVIVSQPSKNASFEKVFPAAKKKVLRDENKKRQRRGGRSKPKQ